jgi:hypothetical protein
MPLAIAALSCTAEWVVTLGSKTIAVVSTTKRAKAEKVTILLFERLRSYSCWGMRFND